MAALAYARRTQLAHRLVALLATRHDKIQPLQIQYHTDLQTLLRYYVAAIVLGFAVYALLVQIVCQNQLCCDAALERLVKILSYTLQKAK